MPTIEELIIVEGGAPAAVGVGGTLILLPGALRLIGRVLRPVAKEVIKVCQAAGDLVAEARSELEQENAANTARLSSTAAGCVITQGCAAGAESHSGLSEAPRHPITEARPALDQENVANMARPSATGRRGAPRKKPKRRST